MKSNAASLATVRFAIGGRFEPDKVATGIVAKLVTALEENMSMSCKQRDSRRGGGEHARLSFPTPASSGRLIQWTFAELAWDVAGYGARRTEWLVQLRQQPYRLQNSKCWGKARGTRGLPALLVTTARRASARTFLSMTRSV